MPAVVYVRQDATVLSKGSPCMGEEVEGTTNIWNTQGFWLKKVNLFVFLAKRLEYSHKRANVLSGECQRQAASEGTTNIWNTQEFM